MTDRGPDPRQLPPPYDEAAELEVLGAALDSAWTAPRPDLHPIDFYVPAHRHLWEATAGLDKPIRPADLPENLRDLARQAVGAWVDPPAAAARVIRATSARNALHYALQLADAARAGDLEQAAAIAHQVAEDLDAA